MRIFSESEPLTLLGAYRYFRRHREANAGVSTLELRRSASKGERNELCLCGSGRKYTRYCGNATVN